MGGEVNKGSRPQIGDEYKVHLKVIDTREYDPDGYGRYYEVEVVGHPDQVTWVCGRSLIVSEHVKAEIKKGDRVHIIDYPDKSGVVVDVCRGRAFIDWDEGFPFATTLDVLELDY